MGSHARLLGPGALVLAAVMACGTDEAASEAGAPSDDKLVPTAPVSADGGGSIDDADGGGGVAIDGGGGEDATPPPPPPPTCRPAPPMTGFANGIGITAAGRARTYALYVPTTYDQSKPYPLVFAFHGDGGTGAGIRTTMKLEAEANGGAIFVYPDGLNKTWELDQGAATNKDIKLVTALIDELSTTFCVDSSRLFATGFSRGAFFANQLACRSPRAFRGVATHGGGGPYGLPAEYDKWGNWSCTAPSPAALVVHGEWDGLGNTGAESRDWWHAENSCAWTNKAYPPPPCVSYNACTAGKPVVFCLIPQMGHALWSNGPAVTWSFFASL